MAYLNFPPIVSIICVIFPLTAWFMGAVQRVTEKRYVAAIIRFFGGLIIWILDIVLSLLDGCKEVKLLDLIKF